MILILKILYESKRTGMSFASFHDTKNKFTGIVKYMIEQAKPAARNLNTIKEVQRFMQKADVTVIGFFRDENSNLIDPLKEAGICSFFQIHSLAR